MKRSLGTRRGCAGRAVALLGAFVAVLYGFVWMACEGGALASHELRVSEERPPFDYAIVLDAGSSGTRMHVYQIPPSGWVRTLARKEVEPGLSFFADEPHGVLRYLQPCFGQPQE